MQQAQALPFLNLKDPLFSTKGQEVKGARAESWCAETPFGFAVLRYREVGLLLRDKRLRQGSYAWPDKNNLKGSFAEFWKRSIISREGKDHRILRDLAIPSLSEDFVDGLVPQFDASANVLANALRGRSFCEFMDDFSIPFAGQAICILLGLPLEQWSQISHDASDLGLAMGINCLDHQETFNAACDRLTALSHQLIARARAGDDQTSYIARLVRRYEEMGLADEQALIDLIVISIFGGVDTTRSQLGFAMALFAEHKDQWQALCADPNLCPQAIEEIIRAWPTTTWATREAVEDFEFQGVEIAKGTTLHMLVHSSARDPQICEEPTFNILTPRKRHFGFGGGAHHCIGHYVARTDMASALRALGRVLDDFDVSDPRYLPDSGNTSPISLPLTYRVR